MCIYQSIAGVVESQSSTSVIQGYFFFFLIITRRQKLKTPLEMAEATDRPTDRPGIHQRTPVDDSFKHPAAKVTINRTAYLFIFGHFPSFI